MKISVLLDRAHDQGPGDNGDRIVRVSWSSAIRLGTSGAGRAGPLLNRVIAELLDIDELPDLLDDLLQAWPLLSPR